jgi:hypothetical protein
MIFPLRDRATVAADRSTSMPSGSDDRISSVVRAKAPMRRVGRQARKLRTT